MTVQEGRQLKVAAAQMGTTNRWDSRESVLERMTKLLESCASLGVELVVFPELAFTTFFPRYIINDDGELHSFYEKGEITSSPNVSPFFERAKQLGLAVSVGYAELTEDGDQFNSCVYVDRNGKVLSKYRKVHLPGTAEPFDDLDAVQQLEKKYFKPGDLGFKAFVDKELKGVICGQMVCNDRRWPEPWRVYGLQGTELVIVGYNTAEWAPLLFGHSPDVKPAERAKTELFHHRLVMQAHSYTNGVWSISAARAGLDDGKFGLIGGSCIVSPLGYIVAEAQSRQDELVVADINLDECKAPKKTEFDFGRHRRIEHYGLIASQTGVILPEPVE